MRTPCCAAAAVLAVSAWLAPAPLAQVEEPPEGLPVGPWILAPALLAGYSGDSNVFYASAEQGPVSDALRTAAPSLRATLPFRNSRFDLAYRATKDRYEEVELVRTLSQEFEAALSLRFSSHDRLEASVSRTLGSSDTQVFDPGGETVFRGQPYDFDRQTVGIQRMVPGKRGWDVRATRSVLDYSDDPAVAYFDYEGFEATALYREPLSPKTWLVADWTGRWFDQYDSADTAPGREPVWKERSGLLRAGVQGLLGPGRPYRVLVGLADFRLTGGSTSSYRGWTADGTLVTRFGAATFLDVHASRRPWPSFFLEGDFYVNESTGVRVEHRWLRRSRFGVEGRWSRAGYESPIPEGYVGEGIVREDRTLRVGVYANLMVHERFGVRISVDDDRRTSNYEFAECRKRVYVVGILLGWYE
mgnify:CR=1 FL=1